METIIYSPDRFSKTTPPEMLNLLSPDILKITGFPLNDFYVNYEKMGFLEIGVGP